MTMKLRSGLRLIPGIVLVFLLALPCLGAEPGPARKAVSAEPGLSIMAGQMIMTGFRGTGEAPLHQDLVFLLEDIAAGRVGGVILFDRDALLKTPDRNIVSLSQVAGLIRMLQEKASIPLFIGVDQEGGKVRRIKEEHGFAPLASAEELGRGSPKATQDTGQRLGKALHSLGINLNFAPCLDVNSNPASPAIGSLGRSFSRQATVVAAHGLAFARGLAEEGVIPCYKHFPGHGSAADDTHLGLADITASWTEEELVPYREILPQSPPAMVMPGHIVHRDMTGNLPASLSPEAVQGLLRGEFGWDGVVITDDLQMQAVEGRYSTKEALRLAVEAGADILLLGNNLHHDYLEARKTHAPLLGLVAE